MKGHDIEECTPECFDESEGIIVPAKTKTAEEVAEEITVMACNLLNVRVLSRQDADNFDAVLKEIAQALTAYAEEREICCWDAKSVCSIHHGEMAKVRAEALEEAARILDGDCEKLAAHGADAPALQCNIQAMKIRALKDPK